MGQTDTLCIEGKKHVQVYHAILGKTPQGAPKHSSGARHFCKHCASCLWIFDPQWPEWVYPFTSAIDTNLPKPPERFHILLKYAANWCDIPKGKHEKLFAEFPEESIAQWHKRYDIPKTIRNI